MRNGSTIWLIGNRGMLGTEVEAELRLRRASWVGTDREVDITSSAALASFCQEQERFKKPIGFIINCAAYTEVDKAENDEQLCYAINTTGPENIARVAADRQAILLHISTDYVFSGEKREPYREREPRSPIGVYGRSKAQGEERIEAVLSEYYIVRTSWLFGIHGANFVRTMLRLFAERDEVRVVADQYGSPTYARDLAAAICDMVLSGQAAWGIYHYTNDGQTSWYGFAAETLRQAQETGLIRRDVKLSTVTTPEYPTKAKRPAYSTLSKEKIKGAFGLSIRSWQEALIEYIYEEKALRERDT